MGLKEERKMKQVNIIVGGENGNEILIPKKEWNGTTDFVPPAARGYKIKSVILERADSNKDKTDAQKQFAKNKLAKTKDRFVWAKFSEDRFCSNLDFETLARLVYLSTFVNYTDYGEESYLMNGLNTKAQKPMTKKELKKVLGLSPRTFDRFLLKVCPVDSNGEIRKGAKAGTTYLSQDAEGKFILNKEYFCRGNLDRGVSTPTNRLFIEYIQRLYHAVKPSQHKQLGIIFALMPWINQEWGVICKNPDVKDYDLIEPMNAKDICGVLGLDARNSEKTIGQMRNGQLCGNLYKALLDIELEINQIRQVFCLAETTKYGVRLIVNPNFIYKGTHKKELMERHSSFVNPKDLIKLAEIKEQVLIG